MDEGEDENEVPRAEKLYCCGNSSQREAIYVSRLDLFVSFFSLLCVLGFSIAFAGYPPIIHHLDARMSNSQAFFDLQDFLRLDSIHQWTILISWSLLLIGEFCVSILLTFAAQQRNYGFCRIWFVLTVVDTIVIVSIHIYLLTVSRSLVLHIVYPIVVFLYKWYGLWICWVLMRRIRAIENGYEQPSEDEFQDVHMGIQQEDKL